MNRLLAMKLAARALWAATALVLVGALVLWLAQRPQFEFRRIEVLSSTDEAPRHVTEASIRAALKGPLKGRLVGNFFTMNLAQAQRLFETVPWVARASVRRVWPDVLVVTVDEHRAIGLWSDGRVLSARGELFVANAAEAELDGVLASFAGPPEQADAAAARFKEFSALLAPLAMSVATLEISERASWSLVTATESGKGPRIELGRDDPAGRVRERLATLTAAWPMVVAQLGGQPKRMDARYANGFAVASLTSPLTGEKTHAR